MTHSILLIGQSNMAGRGFVKDVAPIYDEQIKMLRNGLWQIMTEPINYDRPSAGIGLAASFAAAWRLQNGRDTIGLIPCADGGTSLDDWAVGGALFDHAVFQAKLAQRISKLSGILWHQGESDCFPEKASQYYEKFSVIVDALRHQLNAPDIPLIIGGLGDYLTSGKYGAYFTVYPQVNQALLQFAQTKPNCFFVTAADLTANPDGVHFDAASQRTLGIRYFEAFHNRQHIPTPPANEKQTVAAICEKPLSKKAQTKFLEIKVASGNLTVEEYEAALAKINEP